MWPDQISNPGPLTYESGALPTALHRPASETKITEFANSIDLDEMAHNEPPHLNLHSLPSRI